MKVLVADDDASMRVSLRVALRQAGLLVRTAAHAAAARRLLLAERFDWLVTDGELPPETGLRLAADARRIQPSIRAVLVSGTMAEPHEPRSSVVEKSFVKPVSPDVLIGYLLEAGPAPDTESAA